MASSSAYLRHLQLPAATTASRVCLPCQQRKRKCDKSLPSCRSCIRINRHCHYDDAALLRTASSSTASLKQHHHQFQQEQQEQHLHQPTYHHSNHPRTNKILSRPHRSLVSTSSHPPPNSSNTRRPGLPPPLTEYTSQTPLSYLPLPFPPTYLSPHDPFRHPRSRQALVDTTLTREASRLLGSSIDDLREVAADYFRTIHPWLPIVSAARFTARLPRIWLEPQADFVLLAFCIFLVTRWPPLEVSGADDADADASADAQGGRERQQQRQRERQREWEGMDVNVDVDVGSMRSSVYAMAKGLVALLEAAGGRPSVEVVQARVLVALYEVGHGMDAAAYVSVGAAARYGAALGMAETLRQRVPSGGKAWMEWEEERRVWWGIMVLDRFINVEGPTRSTAISDPTPQDYLPVDDDAWDNNVMPCSGPLPMSTATSVRVGCFAREAQLSHLLGRVLRHVYDASPDPAFNREEALQLHRTLDTMTTLLPMEEAAETCAVYGAALGMCYSARLLLFELSPSYSNSSSPSSSTYHSPSDGYHHAHTTLDLIEASARRVLDVDNHDLHRAAPGGPTPFGAHAFYRAAGIQLRLARETGDARHLRSVALLKAALRRIDRRWKVAGEYLRALETG